MRSHLIIRRKRAHLLSAAGLAGWLLMSGLACLPAAADAADPRPASASDPRPAGASEPRPADADAQRLLDKTLRNLYEGDFVQVFRLESRHRRGRSMTRRLQVVRKESAPPGRAVLRFLSPEDVRGSSMLVIEQTDQPDDVFLFLPATEKTRRISLAQRYDSFFGTNLTYEDLEPKHASDFEARLEGRSEVDGVPCLNLRVRPLEGIESQYDSTVVCIDPERNVALETTYFLGGRSIKRMTVDPKQVVRRDGRWVAEFARLESTANAFTTEITSELYERKASIPDRLFSTWNLEAGSDSSDLRALRSADDPAPQAEEAGSR